MLNYTSPIKDNKNYADLVIKEIGPIIKLNLRGKKKEFLSTVEKRLNIILPTEANTSSSSEKFTAIWLSPDEWMVFSNNISEKNNISYEIEEILYNNISKKNFGSVTDVTDQFVIINFNGTKIFDLFSFGSPFDFNKFKEKKGSATQTILNHIDVIIHNKNSNNVNLFVRRSFSEHLWSWINDCASRL
jgi:sarcosine oxidase subunit gamma